MKKSIIILLIVLECLFFTNKKHFFFKENKQNEGTLAVYVDEEKVKSIPTDTSNYYFDDEKSSCSENAILKWDYTTWSPIITNASTFSHCEIYFKKCSININDTFIFAFSNKEDTFTIPCPGNYKFEAYGARGGNGYSTYLTTNYSLGGLGAYVRGNLFLDINTLLYINVGGKGEDTTTDKNSLGIINGGYNGGGTGRSWDNGNKYVHNGAGGGGATHIALKSGLLKDLKEERGSILLVATGGGGGGGHQGLDIGGYAGGLIGGNGFRKFWDLNTGGTQISGGKSDKENTEFEKGEDGEFGKGGNSSLKGGGAGGGAGYYGGAGGEWNSGGGGSSYIKDNTFTNSLMIDGEGYLWTTKKESYIGMPSFNDSSFMVGNNENGYVKITYLGCTKT